MPGCRVESTLWWPTSHGVTENETKIKVSTFDQRAMESKKMRRNQSQTNLHWKPGSGRKTRASTKLWEGFCKFILKQGTATGLRLARTHQWEEARLSKARVAGLKFSSHIWYISCVTYSLPPHMEEEPIVVHDPPFVLGRVSDSYFDSIYPIQVEITF